MSVIAASVIASVNSYLRERGEELVNAEELLGPSPQPRSRPPAPAAGEQWLSCKEAGVRYSDVWIARSRSGAAILVHVTSHRRPRGAKHRRWYGVNVVTGREVQIHRVLAGSRR